MRTEVNCRSFAAHAAFVTVALAVAAGLVASTVFGRTAH